MPHLRARLFASAALLFPFLATAQQPRHAPIEVCATTTLTAAANNNNPLFARALVAHERTLRQRLGAQVSGARGGGTITIPIVVHVVHNGGAENLSNATIINGIQQLNDAFANTGTFLHPDGYDTGIQFCLAQRDPDGNATSGIEHIASPLTDLTAELEDAQLKALSHWDPLSYINLYVVRAISSISVGDAPVGYANLPNMHGQPTDGAVVEFGYIGGANENAVATIHELGHYLGLYHTFEGGCTNNDCLSDGDKVCDTPPDDHVANVGCDADINSCSSDDDDTSLNNPFRPVGLGGLGDQIDPYDNFMDYGVMGCHVLFTQGQGDRMQATLQTTRASLLDSQGCDSPCSIAFNAAFSISTGVAVPVTVTATFTNQSTPATSYLWELDGAFYANTLNTTASFPVEGAHTMVLTVQDAVNNCIASASNTFNVICPGQASFTASEQVVLPGDTVVLTNTSNSGTYVWHLDGAVYSTAEDTVFVVPGPGTYTIYVTSTNSLCTNTSASITLTTGNCHDWNPEMNWYFADSASLNFSSGMPVAGANSAMYCREGTASISDNGGNLLFYSNGLTIWDRNHQPMPNGTGLLGGQLTSSFNQAMAVPWPGSTTAYALITMDEVENQYANGVRWNKVDMTLNGGMGDVTFKNQFIHAQGMETMAAVYHSNGTDVWFMFPRASPARLEARLLTANGFQSPVISVMPGFDNIMHPIFSHSGKRMAVSWRTPFPFFHKWSLYDFDPATGQLSNQLDFDLEGDNFATDFEFSLNDQVLYQVDFDGIHQFDLAQTSAAAIQASMVTVGNPIGGIHMRMAPNGRIYTDGGYGSTGIDAINFPNNLGAACVYVNNNVVNVAPAELELSVPIFVRGTQFHATVDLVAPDTACTNGTTTVSVQYPDPDCAYTWYVNNIVTPPTSGDTLLTFPYAGTDSAVVRVTKACACGYTSGTRTVEYTNPPVYSLGPDTVVCAGSTVVLNAGPGSSYTWSDGTTQQTASINTPGTVWVEVLNANGCVLRDTVLITEIPLIPPVDLGPNDTTCVGQVTVLDAGPGFFSYQWQDLSNAQTFTASQPGTYWVTVTSSCGISTDTIQVVDAGVDLVDLGPDTMVCDNTPVVLVVSGNPFTTLWNDGSTNDQITVIPPAITWVEVTSDHGCAERDSIILSLDAVPPLLDCPADTVVVIKNGNSVQVEVPLPSASDTCPFTVVNSFNGTANASGIYPLGSTLVIWTATDQAGNTSVCTTSVTVSNENAVGDIDCANGSVAPNPNDGRFVLQLPCTSQRADAVLINALGQQVSEQMRVLNGTHAISVDGLAPGHYTLRVIVAGSERHLPVLIAR